MPKINILIFISSFTGGGAELVATNLVKCIDRRHFNVYACYTKTLGYRGEHLKNNGFPVYSTSKDTESNNLFTSAYNLINIIDELNIDLVHSHNSDVFIESSIAKMMRRHIATVHTFHFGNYPHLPKQLKLFEYSFWRLHTRLIAVGHRQSQSISNTYHIDPKKLTTIYNGVENFDESPLSLKHHPFFRNRLIIGSISTLIPQKGLFDLLEIAKMMRSSLKKKVAFLIVGDGPLLPDLMKYRYDNNLQDFIYFLGWIKEAPKFILPSFDVFVQTSHWEAMSMVLLEAFAAKKPVIATDVGENKYIINHGKNGFLVRKSDLSKMIDYINCLVSSADLRFKIGKHAYEDYQSKYSVNYMCKQYENIYRSSLLKISGKLHTT